MLDEKDTEVPMISQSWSSLIILYILAQLVKQALVPRVHGLALKTTVAAVCELIALLNLHEYYYCYFSMT